MAEKNEKPQAPDPDLLDELVAQMVPAFKGMAKRLLNIDEVRRRTVPPPTLASYTTERHHMLLVCRANGYNNSSAAKAMGISLTTLQRWFEVMPELEEESEQAAKIMGLGILQRYFKTMDRNNPAAVKALMHFIDRILPEFKDGAMASAEKTDIKQLTMTIRGIYGLADAPTKTVAVTEVASVVPLDDDDDGLTPPRPPVQDALPTPPPPPDDPLSGDDKLPSEPLPVGIDLLDDI